MSKNFEEEYKALANEDLPDLWNRIEAGLTNKDASLMEDEKRQDEKPASGKTPPKDNFGKIISFFTRYRTAAAAILCVVVAIPAFLLLGRTGKDQLWEGAEDTASQEMAEETSQEMAEEAAPAEEAPEHGETGQGGNLATAECYDGAAEEDLDDIREEDRKEQRKSSGETDDALAGAVLSDVPRPEERDGGNSLMADKKMETVEESAKTESQEEKELIKVYKKVTVRVIEVTKETVNTDDDVYYGVKMEVIEDPMREWKEGDQFTVWIPVTSSKVYVEGEEDTVDFSYDPDRQCPYRIN